MNGPLALGAFLALVGLLVTLAWWRISRHDPECCPECRTARRLAALNEETQAQYNVAPVPRTEAIDVAAFLAAAAATPCRWQHGDADALYPSEREERPL